MDQPLPFEIEDPELGRLVAEFYAPISYDRTSRLYEIAPQAEFLQQAIGAIYVGFNSIRLKKPSGQIKKRFFKQPNDLCGCGSGRKVKRCHRE